MRDLALHARGHFYKKGVWQLTANDVFSIACAYISQTAQDTSELLPFVPMWLNVLLAESLDAENALRRFDKMPELAAAPRMGDDDMQSEIVYHDAIVRIALPYGLAREIFRDDENEYRAGVFDSKFVYALAETMRVRGERVVDVYA